MGTDPANLSAGRDNIMAPLTGFAAITPNDSNDMTYHSRGIYCGVSGDIKITSVGGDTVTLVGVASGVFHPIRAKRIFATGTDATDIVAGW